MNAPDKIYIDVLAVVNDCITKNSTKPLPNFVEYIRKDALLEWAKELNFLVKDEPGASFKGAEVVINEVIKKIQSL